MTFPRRIALLVVAAGVAGSLLAAVQDPPPPPTKEAKPVEGIDVSHYQGAIDWSRVEGAGIEFAYIKATQGTRWVDPRFKENWKAVAGTSIRRGAYHFLEPDVDGTRQAKHFLATVELEAGDLLPVVDVETPGPDLATNLERFLAEVRRQKGYEAMIYVSPAFWNDHLAGRRETPWPNPLWVAEYGVSTPKATRGIGPWIIWQYTQDGRVEGIEGPVDRDRARTVATHDPGKERRAGPEADPSGS
ncbi:MAG: glycoside hydrolase family 25 protein [Planctomycetota bacterium]|nr:glycoside hydrolase family 25 protein [Planctomycetota bacterium]